MKLIDMMMQEKENLQAVLNNCRRLLRHLPRGTLIIQEKSGHRYYHKYVDGNTVYLRHGSAEIRRLKDRKLVEVVMDNAENDLQLMDGFLSGYKEYDPNELIRSFDEAYKDVSRSAVTAMGFAFTLDYGDFEAGNPKHMEHLKQITSAGKKRRSKSEVIIDRIYDELQYDVMYEKPLVFSDGEEVTPDYTTWSEFRKVELYHEHIGNLTDPDIMKMNFWKYGEYVRNGLYPFDRVLFTFDKPSSGIDAENIKVLIRTFMQ